MTEAAPDTPQTTTDTFKVHVHVHEDPFWVQRPKGLVFPDVSNDETVSEFRLRLSQQPGKPTPDSIKLVVSGKPIGLARGGERLKDVLTELDKSGSGNILCMVTDWNEDPPKPEAPTASSSRPVTPIPTSKPAPQSEPLSKPWDTIQKQLGELSHQEHHKLVHHCRLFGTYLLTRLNSETEALGPPFSDFHFDFPPMTAPLTPKIPLNNPQVENSAMLLVDSLELSPTVHAFEDLAQQDMSRVTVSGATDASHQLDQLKSMRRHQGLLSIFASLLHILANSQTTVPDLKMATQAGHDLLTYMAYGGTLRTLPVGAAGPPRPNGQPRLGAMRDLLGPPFQPGMPLHQQLPGAENLQNPLAGLAAAGLQNNAAYLSITAGPAGQPPDRTVSLHFNLGELRRTLLPFMWLTLKLSFFLWIFGRHAASNKRVVLCILALLCVLWETWAFRARRAVDFRRQVQQAFNRERAAANQEIQTANRNRPAQQQIPEVGPLPEGAIQPPALVQVQTNARHPRQPQLQDLPQLADAGQLIRLRQIRVQPAGPGAAPQPTASSRRRSPWTASYWISRIAGVSLATEARETGLRALLHRRDNCGLTQASLEKYTIIRDEQRWVRRLRTGVILFFGSLIPEVERKRRRALEKRDRVMREIRAECEKQEARLAEELAKFREKTGRQQVSEDNEDEEGLRDSSDSDQAADPQTPARDIARADGSRTARLVNSLLENSRAPTPDPQAARDGQPRAVEEQAQAPAAERQEPPAAAADPPIRQLEQPQNDFVQIVNEPLAALQPQAQDPLPAAAGAEQQAPDHAGPLGAEEAGARFVVEGENAAAVVEGQNQEVARAEAGAIDDDDEEEREGDNEVGLIIF